MFTTEKSVTFGDKNQRNAQFDWLIDVMLKNEEGVQEILVIVEDVTHGV